MQLQPYTVECDVDIEYDGNCSPSAANCNININVDSLLLQANNELTLNYLLETGIFCNNVRSSCGQSNLSNKYTKMITTLTVTRN